MTGAQRTRGSYMLGRVGATQHEIAARVGTTQPKVSRWIAAVMKPGVPNRIALEREFAIPPSAWDEPWMQVERKPRAPGRRAQPAPPDPQPVDDRSVRAEAQRLMDQVRALRTRVANDASATPSEQAKVYAAAAQTLTLLGKMTGETLVVTESRILRLPAWRRIEDQLVEILTPWPAAMRAVGDALAAMGE